MYVYLYEHILRLHVTSKSITRMRSSEADHFTRWRIRLELVAPLAPRYVLTWTAEGQHEHSFPLSSDRFSQMRNIFKYCSHDPIDGKQRRCLPSLLYRDTYHSLIVEARSYIRVIPFNDARLGHAFEIIVTNGSEQDKMRSPVFAIGDLRMWKVIFPATGG